MSQDPSTRHEPLTPDEEAEVAAAQAPAGFKHLQRGGPYFVHLGPLFSRRDEANMVVIGLRVGKKHTNMLGITHGGMLVTFADGAMGINLSISRDPPQSMVSVHLSSDFLDSARPGDWLEAHTRIRKQGSRLTFADCELRVGDRVMLRCTGVFATVGKPGQPLPSDNGG
jgi:uncharacterized protein (TIGR00369 family)